MDWFEQTTLTGRHVRLEPLAEQHTDDLFALCGNDIPAWAWMFAPAPTTREQMLAVVRGTLAQVAAGRQVAWAVVRDDRAVGFTSFLDIEPQHRRLEIGGTCYGRSVWATAVNPEAKLLLLGRAFDDLGALRVALKTDHRNERSQTAISRLGATREGVLRAHMVRPDGSRRDTVYYSVLAAEWPAVRAGLLARLEQF